MASGLQIKRLAMRLRHKVIDGLNTENMTQCANCALRFFCTVDVYGLKVYYCTVKTRLYGQDLFL